MESLVINGSLPRTSPCRVAADLCSLVTGARVSRSFLSNIRKISFVTGRQQQPSIKHINCLFGKFSLYQRRNTKYLVAASSERPLESTRVGHEKSLGGSVKDTLDAFYRFTRPYAALGTAWNIISFSLIPIEKLSDFSPLVFSGVLKAIVAVLLMHIYVVGLNQLSDIEIDKVNKPFLPLASGEFSVTAGVMISSVSAIMSFWLGLAVGSWPLLCALFLLFPLGSAYSIDLPLLRWKTNPFMAAMYMLVKGALIYPISFYLHVQTYALGRPAVPAKPLIFGIAIMAFIYVALAFIKDIPDIEGDQMHGFRSFAAQMGQKRMFWISVWLLEMAYALAVLVGASSSILWSKCITVLGHGVLASLLWIRANSNIDMKDKNDVQSFYMFIWKLLMAECLLIPLVRGI